MGIKGLYSYIKDYADASLEWHKLQNCKIVIDGNNLAHEIYSNSPGINTAFGGDYDKYAFHVGKFFTRLIECHVEPIVVMDGGYPMMRNKFNTVYSRLSEQLETSMAVNIDNQKVMRIFPILGRSVFVSVAQKLGVMVLQCDFEADDEIVVLAKKLNAYVLSNDSDFYLFDVPFILLHSVNMKHIQKEQTPEGKTSKFIPCYRFDVKTFTRITGLRKELIPLLAPMLGNDFMNPKLLEGFHTRLASLRPTSKHIPYRKKIIISVIKWLTTQHGTAEEVLQRMIDLKAMWLTKKSKEILFKVLAMYSPTNSKLESWFVPHKKNCPLKTTDDSSSNCSTVPFANFKPGHFISDIILKEFSCTCQKRVCNDIVSIGEMPDWFVRAYRQHLIPHTVTDILTKDYFFTTPMIEAMELKSVYLRLEVLIKKIRGILWNTCASGLSMKNRNIDSEILIKKDSELPMKNKNSSSDLSIKGQIKGVNSCSKEKDGFFMNNLKASKYIHLNKNKKQNENKHFNNLFGKKKHVRNNENYVKNDYDKENELIFSNKHEEKISFQNKELRENLIVGTEMISNQSEIEYNIEEEMETISNKIQNLELEQFNDEHEDGDIETIEELQPDNFEKNFKETEILDSDDDVACDFPSKPLHEEKKINSEICEDKVATLKMDYFTNFSKDRVSHNEENSQKVTTIGNISESYEDEQESYEDVHENDDSSMDDDINFDSSSQLSHEEKKETNLKINEDKIASLVMNYSFNTQKSHKDENLAKEEIVDIIPDSCENNHENGNRIIDDENGVADEDDDSEDSDEDDDSETKNSEDSDKDDYSETKNNSNSTLNNIKEILYIPPLRLFVRDRQTLIAKNLIQENISTYKKYPSLFTIRKSSELKRKKLFNRIANLQLDLINEDLPSKVEFILLCISFWKINYAKHTNLSTLLSILMCVVMFTIIDEKIGRVRAKGSPEEILNFVNKIKAKKETGRLPEPSTLTIRELIENLTPEECRLASIALNPFHTIDSTVNKNYYDRYRIHSFSEYQASVYFLQYLNSLLCFPFPAFSMDSIWSGTFSYNVYNRFVQKKDIGGVLSILFTENDRIAHLFLKLFSVLQEKLDIPEFEVILSKRTIHKNIRKKVLLKKKQLEKESKAAKTKKDNMENEACDEIETPTEDFVLLGDNKFSALLNL